MLPLSIKLSVCPRGGKAKSEDMEKKKKKIILKYWFLTKTFETEIPMFTSLPSIFFSFARIKQVHHGDYSTESIPQHGNLLFTSKEKKGNKIRQLSFQASDNNNKDETKA